MHLHDLLEYALNPTLPKNNLLARKKTKSMREETIAEEYKSTMNVPFYNVNLFNEIVHVNSIFFDCDLLNIFHRFC